MSDHHPTTRRDFVKAAAVASLLPTPVRLKADTTSGDALAQPPATRR